jgi:hypothetical protein
VKLKGAAKTQLAPRERGIDLQRCVMGQRAITPEITNGTSAPGMKSFRRFQEGLLKLIVAKGRVKIAQIARVF